MADSTYLDRNINNEGVAPLKEEQDPSVEMLKQLNIKRSLEQAAGRSASHLVNVPRFSIDRKVDRNIGDISFSDPQQLEDVRYKNQRAMQRIGRSAINFGAIAGSTLLDMTIGSFGKLFEMSYDNGLSRTFNSISETSQERHPIHRPTGYEEMSIGRQMGSSVFWADLIQNMGFTTGMLAGGAIAGALTGGTGTALMVATAGLSALSEAGTEALGAKDDYIKEKADLLNMEYFNRAQSITTPEEKAALDEWFANKYMEIQTDGNSVGNAVFGANAALLTVSNMAGWGSILKRGFNPVKGMINTEAKISGVKAVSKEAFEESAKATGKKPFKETVKDTFTKVKDKFTNPAAETSEEVTEKALGSVNLSDVRFKKGSSRGWSTTKNVLKHLGEASSESIEEVSQGLIGDMAVRQPSVMDFTLTENDEEQTVKADTFVNTFLQVLKDAFQDNSTAMEAIMGGFTSLIGVPGFAHKKTKSGKSYVGPVWNGQIGEFIADQRKDRAERDYIDSVNKALASGNIDKLIKGYARTSAYERKKMTAAKLDDEFNFKNYDLASMISTIVAFDNIGHLGMLKQNIAEARNLTDEELTSLAEQLKTDYGVSTFVKDDGSVDLEEIRKVVKKNTDWLQEYVDLYSELNQKLDATKLGLNDNVKQNYIYAVSQIRDWENRRKEIGEELFDILKKDSVSVWIKDGLDVTTAESMTDLLVKDPSFRKNVINRIKSDLSIDPMTANNLLKKIEDLEKIDKGIAKFNAEIKKIWNKSEEYGSLIDAEEARTEYRRRMEAAEKEAAPIVESITESKHAVSDYLSLMYREAEVSRDVKDAVLKKFKEADKESDIGLLYDHLEGASEYLRDVLNILDSSGLSDKADVVFQKLLEDPAYAANELDPFKASVEAALKSVLTDEEYKAFEEKKKALDKARAVIKSSKKKKSKEKEGEGKKGLGGADIIEEGDKTSEKSDEDKDYDSSEDEGYEDVEEDTEAKEETEETEEEDSEEEILGEDYDEDTSDESEVFSTITTAELKDYVAASEDREEAIPEYEELSRKELIEAIELFRDGEISAEEPYRKKGESRKRERKPEKVEKKKKAAEEKKDEGFPDVVVSSRSKRSKIGKKESEAAAESTTPTGGEDAFAVGRLGAIYDVKKLKEHILAPNEGKGGWGEEVMKTAGLDEFLENGYLYEYMQERRRAGKPITVNYVVLRRNELAEGETDPMDSMDSKEKTSEEFRRESTVFAAIPSEHGNIVVYNSAKKPVRVQLLGVVSSTSDDTTSENLKNFKDEVKEQMKTTTNTRHLLPMSSELEFAFSGRFVTSDGIEEAQDRNLLDIMPKKKDDSGKDTNKVDASKVQIVIYTESSRITIGKNLDGVEVPLNPHARSSSRLGVIWLRVREGNGQIFHKYIAPKKFKASDYELNEAHKNSAVFKKIKNLCNLLSRDYANLDKVKEHLSDLHKYLQIPEGRLVVLPNGTARIGETTVDLAKEDALLKLVYSTGFNFNVGSGELTLEELIESDIFKTDLLSVFNKGASFLISQTVINEDGSYSNIPSKVARNISVHTGSREFVKGKSSAYTNIEGTVYTKTDDGKYYIYEKSRRSKEVTSPVQKALIDLYLDIESGRVKTTKFWVSPEGKFPLYELVNPIDEANTMLVAVVNEGSHKSLHVLTEKEIKDHFKTLRGKKSKEKTSTALYYKVGRKNIKAIHFGKTLHRQKVSGYVYRDEDGALRIIRNIKDSEGKFPIRVIDYTEKAEHEKGETVEYLVPDYSVSGVMKGFFDKSETFSELYDITGEPETGKIPKIITPAVLVTKEGKTVDISKGVIEWVDMPAETASEASDTEVKKTKESKAEKPEGKKKEETPSRKKEEKSETTERRSSADTLRGKRRSSASAGPAEMTAKKVTSELTRNGISPIAVGSSLFGRLPSGTTFSSALSSIMEEKGITEAVEGLLEKGESIDKIIDYLKNEISCRK